MLKPTDINTMIDGEKLANFTLNEASILYMSYEIDKDFIEGELANVRQALNMGDITTAQYQAFQVQDAVLDRRPDMVSSRIRANDHIALTQFMLNHQKTEAARYALDIAEDALLTLNQGTDDLVAISALRKKILELEGGITRAESSINDENTMQPTIYEPLVSAHEVY
jgi:hypothetical protein